MKTNLKTIQVVLNTNPEHFKMIQRCAKLREKSVEKWIMQAIEGELRYDMDEFGYIGVEVGFGNDEIDKAAEEAAV